MGKKSWTQHVLAQNDSFSKGFQTSHKSIWLQQVAQIFTLGISSTLLKDLLKDHFEKFIGCGEIA